MTDKDKKRSGHQALLSRPDKTEKRAAALRENLKRRKKPGSGKDEKSR